MSDEGLKIFFWLDEDKQGPGRSKKGNSIPGTLKGVPLSFSERQEDGKLVDFSSIVGDGGGGGTIQQTMQPHDFVKYTTPTIERIITLCGPLRKKGLTYRQIEDLTSIPKTTISQTLNKAKRIQNNRLLLARRERKNAAPFGFCYHNGEIVMDPREAKIVQIINQLRDMGKTFKDIAKHLNEKNFLTRTGKNWSKQTIAAIFKRKNRSQTHNNQLKDDIKKYG